MARFCTRCGTAVQPQFAFCPKCGAPLPKLPAEPEEPTPSARATPAQPRSAPPSPAAPQTGAPKAGPSGRAVTFSCRDSRAVIGEARIPEGWSYTAKLFQEDYNDFSPLRDAVLVYNNELGVTIRTDSKVFWEEYCSQLMKQGAALGGLNPRNEGAYREPEELMLAYGKPTPDAVLHPVAQADLPGWFRQNGPALLRAMIQSVIDSDRLVQNVKTDIVNTTCQPLLIKFSGQDRGKPIVVLVGCEFLGFEYRNAVNPLSVMGGALGLLGGLMSMKQSASAPDGSVPFGHGREYGRQTDVVRWGYHRIYSCVCPPEQEEAATRAFLNFVVSFRPDPALEERRARREAEIQAQVIRQSNRLSAQARQGQLMAQQRAMETSRMIARNSADISAGIMDSWNKKMASDSRISAARSEAIRGVNTYQTSSGRPVEVDVAADHVYQNNYGDVYGVSGGPVDQETLNDLNWTEIFRK